MKRKTNELIYEVECGPEDVLYTFVYEVEPYDPGVSYGPPENCYPPEGGTANVYEVRGPDGVEIDQAKYKELGINIEKIEEACYLEWCESQEPDEPPDRDED